MIGYKIQTNRVGESIALGLLFFYFLTLSMDLIKIELFQFSLKVCHVSGIGLSIFALCYWRSFFINKRLFCCFLWVLSSALISSFFSMYIERSLTYCFIFLFSFIVYFITPLSMIYFGDREKILKLYTRAFLCIGVYAAMQFFFSLAGIILPFTTQQVVYIRASGFALEPSFYALYAIPIVTYLNAKMLLDYQTEKKRWISVFLANLFLVVSTSTTALLSYFVFFFLLLFFSFYSPFAPFFKQIRKLCLKGFCLLVTLIVGAGLIFPEMFKKTLFKFFAKEALSQDSFNDRWFGIVNAVRIFQENPFFGVGLGGVGPRVYQERLYEGQGGAINEYDRLAIEHFEPSNVATEVLSSLGIYGFLGFLALLYVIWIYFRRALAQPNLEPRQRTQALALLISGIVMIICLQVNQGLFRSYIWVHTSLAIGYILTLQPKKNSL